jgi:protein-tyrosine phosphatase
VEPPLLVNAANTRDLGGYPTADGRMVRRGVLYRASALSRLTDADLSRLAQLGLACVVDFQHPDEIAMVGPDRLPVPPPGRIISLPLFDPEHDVFTTVSALLTGRAGEDRVAQLRADHDGSAAVAAMLGLYRWMVRSATARQAFASVLRLIASGEALPLLFHCTAGKDRTGWLAAVVLSLLGVERAVVIDDYLRTNIANAEGTARVLARLSDHLPTALLRPLLEARLDYLMAGFTEMEQAYGDVAGYVRDGLALDDATVAALRANLLTDLLTDRAAG